MLLPSVLQLGIMGWFELNQNRIASEWCVNRNRPQLNCNGKCYLKQQLKKTEEQKQKQILRWQQQEWNWLDVSYTRLPQVPLSTADVSYGTEIDHGPANPMKCLESPPPEQRNV